MELFQNLRTTLEKVKAQGPGAVEQVLAKAQPDLLAFVEHLKAAAAQNPEPIFAVLRETKPILQVKNVVVVTRFDDVQEVLSRDDIFHVTYGEKMRVITGGNDFFLGMQNSPEYERDVAHMRSVIRRHDIVAISQFVERTAKEVVARSGGNLEVVNQLTRLVPARWIAHYFGCVPPSDRDLADWGSAIFQYLFTDLKNDPEVGRVAREAAAKARAWLDAAVATRKASGEKKDDVLGRCLALQGAGLPGMDDLGIRNNLIGLIVGAIPTTSKCCVHALDQLLNRPEQLAGAQAAARTGDDALLSRYVFEALRFNPNNPGVFRIAVEDYVVAKGALHATMVQKGSLVLAATQSAMFDFRKVDAPNDFRIDRPDWNYMHWGYSLHTCFGQYINQVQIPSILKPLLAAKSLRRADGDAGKMHYSGPFPSALNVTLELAAAAG